MDRGGRLALYGHVAEGFFASADWLAGATGIPGVALKVAAGLTRLVIDQAQARWEAILDQPIGVLPSGYDVPGPDEVIDLFSIDADPPILALQFRPEVEAGDWEALQRAHQILHEVRVLQRPLLRRVFGPELAAQDYRAIVTQYARARAVVEAVLGHPRTRNLLREWYVLVTGGGPERSDREARARLAEHWRRLARVVVEEIT